MKSSESESESDSIYQGVKPDYTADRRKQLCYRCGYYCARSARFCPNCHGKPVGEFKRAPMPRTKAATPELPE